MSLSMTQNENFILFIYLNINNGQKKMKVVKLLLCKSQTEKLCIQQIHRKQG